MARKKISFAGAPLPSPPATGPITEFKLTDRKGSTAVWKFEAVGIPTVSRELGTYLGPSLQEALRGLVCSSVRDHDYAWRLLGRQLRAVHGDSDISLSALTDTDIDACDKPGCMTQIRALVDDLRRIDEAAPALFSDAVKVRLRKVSRYKLSAGKRREPLSHSLADRLLAKADEHVAEAKARIDAGEKLVAELEAAPCPTSFMLAKLRLLLGEKPTTEDANIFRGLNEPTWPHQQAAHLTMDDAVAFAIAIGLRMEMPIECLRDLRRTCIARSTGRSAWIEYSKGRGGTSERRKQERVRDGGINTPGGLLRLLHRLTQPAIDRLPADSVDRSSLWIGVRVTRSGVSKLSLSNNAFCRTIAKWGIRDDDGNPIERFAPARMRKTTKSTNYRRKGGNVARFATDNSKLVAMRHYAAVDDLAEEHAQSIEAAERRLLQTAMVPTVLPPEAEAVAAAGGITINGRQISEDDFRELTSGDHDTFLGICLDFWKSPYGAEKDGACPVPYTPCLHCRNAVFVRGKLVPLITLLIWIEDRRSIMGHDEWLAAHGLDRARIRLQILPRFDPSDVDAAWAIARESGAAPVLPPHWTHA